MRRLTVCAVLCLIASSALASSDLDFEQPQDGWAKLSGEISRDEQSPLRGKRCLALETSGEPAAWAVSEQIPEIPAGELVELNLGLRRVSGNAEIALALCESAQIPDGPVLWQGTPADNERWHRLVLRIVTGITSPRLAIGAVAGAGRWCVDDIRIRSVRLAPVTRQVNPADRPEYCETLPDGWTPKDEGDLRDREIMGIRSVYILPGSLELNPEREVTIRRGERTGMYMDMLSRTEARKSLRIDAIGPLGWRGEVWTTQVAQRGSRPINLPIQPMLAGDTDIKLVFQSDGDTKQMPVRVHSQRYYPALGVSWQGPPPAGVDLKPLQRLPAQFHHVHMGAGDDPSTLAALAQTRADIALTWDAPTTDALTGVLALPEALKPYASAFGLERPGIEDAHMQEFAAAAQRFSPSAVVLSRPFNLRTSPQGLTGGEDLAQALKGDLARRVHALSIRLPRLPGSVVLREIIDGKTDESPMTVWDRLDREWQTATLRNLLRQHDAQLPFLADSIGGKSTGIPGLDALMMARVIIHVFAMGANGVTVPALPPSPGDIALLKADGKVNEDLAAVYGELTRELAGVRSLTPPESSDIAAYEPGKPITYRPFLRGDEGIIALWNNSMQAQEIAVDLRATPFEMRVLRISYPGELIQREYDGDFEWSALARTWGQPAVYMRIEPLQFVILSLKLRAPHAQWLREVGPRPPDASEKKGKPKGILLKDLGL